MDDHQIQLGLSAILASDIAGYTRHMERATEGAVAAWRVAQADIE